MNNLIILPRVPQGKELWFLTGGKKTSVFTTRELSNMYKEYMEKVKIRKELAEDEFERTTDRFGRRYKDPVVDMAEDMVKHKTGISSIDEYWVDYLRRHKGIKDLTEIKEAVASGIISEREGKRLIQKTLKALERVNR